MDEVESKFFLRIQVHDKPGVLAFVSKTCGDNQVSINSVNQHIMENNKAELIIITHKVKEKLMQNAINQIKASDLVDEVESLIRVGL